MRVSIHESVNHFNMKGAGIGIDRNGGDSHLAGGLDHSASDLATVGNQNFLEHGTPGITFYDCNKGSGRVQSSCHIQHSWVARPIESHLSREPFRDYAVIKQWDRAILWAN